MPQPNSLVFSRHHRSRSQIKSRLIPLSAHDFGLKNSPAIPPTYEDFAFTLLGPEVKIPDHTEKDVRSSIRVVLFPINTNAIGYLINNEPICNPMIELRNSGIYYKNTTFDVTIPASVGPSGNHYVLMIRTTNTDGTYYGVRLESNVFNLSGGTGAWARFETQGNTLWGDDGIACGGYDCVRQCAATSNMNSTSSETGYRACANSCPNVFIDPSSTRGGQATAPLTQATPCSNAPTSTSATTGVTSTAGTSTSRRVAAAAGTGAASPALVFNYPLFRIVFSGILYSFV